MKELANYILYNKYFSELLFLQDGKTAKISVQRWKAAKISRPQIWKAGENHKNWRPANFA
jgi:hypothetical protein